MIAAASGVVVIALTVLDDALTLMRFGVAPEHRLDPITLRASSKAVEVLLDALRVAHVDPVEEAPDPPSLAIVERAGIPAVDAGRYAQATAALTTRRALLCAFVNSDGWGWGESTRPPEA